MGPTQANEDGATRLMDVVEHAESASLEAVRNFLDTVDSVFPVLAATRIPVARCWVSPPRRRT
jgi:hypothetical protein